MKKITLILIPLLSSFNLYAKDISSNSTFHQYAKPGAPIEMSYTSEKVDINEISDVNITLSTGITKGTLSASINLDKDLRSLNAFDKELSYEIKPNEQDFLINLKVKASSPGLYYIRLLTKVDKGYGIKLRAFAVPVYIGEKAKIIKKSLNSQMKALGSGENISVSKAVETIEVIKE